MNYTWNQLIDEERLLEEEVYYNTAEHSVSVVLGLRNIADRWAFNLAGNWVDAIPNYFSLTFLGPVPAYITLDGSISYRMPDIKSTLKFGAQNMLNHRYAANLQGPILGGVYYVTFTYDSFLGR